MKAKLLFSLALLATLSMISCDKDKDEEPTTVKIGNKDYPIVKIGTQTWTAANYSGEGGVTYNNDNSKPEYGKYYTLAEAKAITLPAGWRLPTKTDFIKLVEAQGTIMMESGEEGETHNRDAIKKLISQIGWANNSQGTNVSGFNAFPGGYMYNSEYRFQGLEAIFWTNSISSQNNPFYFSLYFDATEAVAYYSVSGDTQKRNVRFVRDNN